MGLQGKFQRIPRQWVPNLDENANELAIHGVGEHIPIDKHSPWFQSLENTNIFIGCLNKKWYMLAPSYMDLIYNSAKEKRTPKNWRNYFCALYMTKEKGLTHPEKSKKPWTALTRPGRVNQYNTGWANLGQELPWGGAGSARFNFKQMLWKNPNIQFEP